MFVLYQPFKLIRHMIHLVKVMLKLNTNVTQMKHPLEHIVLSY